MVIILRITVRSNLWLTILDDLLYRTKASTSLRAPSSRNRKLFALWMTTEQPLVAQEMGYFNRVDDLVNLSEEEESRWLDGVVEDVLTCLLPTEIMQVKSQGRLRRIHKY